MRYDLSVTCKVERRILRNIVSCHVRIDLLDIRVVPIRSVVLEQNGCLSAFDFQNNLGLEVEWSVLVGNDVIELLLILHWHNFERLGTCAPPTPSAAVVTGVSSTPP